MANTYTNCGLIKVEYNTANNTWWTFEHSTRDMIDEAITGVVSLALTADVSLVTVDGDSGSTFADAGRHKVVQLTGTPGAVRTVTVSPNTLQKTYVIDNQADEDVVIAQGSGNTVTVPSGHIITVYCDGGGTTAAVYLISSSIEALTIAASDETTALTTGTAKATFRLPYAFVLTDVRASVSTAPTTSNIIVDINVTGTGTILSTKLNIDAGDKTSIGSATGYALSATDIADDAEITIDIDQIGSGTAGAGLKVSLIGRKQ